MIVLYHLEGPQNGGVRNRRVGVGSVKSLDLGKSEVKDNHRKEIKWSRRLNGRLCVSRESDKNDGIRRFLSGTQSEVGLAIGWFYGNWKTTASLL